MIARGGGGKDARNPSEDDVEWTRTNRRDKHEIPFRKSLSTPSCPQQRDSSLLASHSNIETCFSEGDAAAGGGGTASECRPLVGDGNDNFNVNQDDDLNQDVIERMTFSNSPSSTAAATDNNAEARTAQDSPLDYLRERAWSGLNMLLVTENIVGVPSFSRDDDENDHNKNDDGEDGNKAGNVNAQRRGESGGGDHDDDNDRNSDNEIYDVDYAPSGPSVLGAALDLTLPVLFNFHMFVVLMKSHYNKVTEEGGSDAAADLGGIVAPNNSTSAVVPSINPFSVNESDDAFGGGPLQLFAPPEVPPKVLPLIFLSGAIIRTQFPRRQRLRFYKAIIQGTLLAPFSPVRFRDAFIGDCITSLVRPIVDIVFTATYYFLAVYGFFSRKYDLNEAGYIVSESWLLHGVVLPLVAILPLWMRFLQTLRQAYDTGKRWPYLGNAFKYLSAGLVVLYGMTHAAGDRGMWWILSFTVTTLYQIVWDSCIDWELLVVVSNDAREMKETSSSSSSTSSYWRRPTCISSLNPRFFPTTLLMYVVQPFRRRVSQPLWRLYEVMPKRFDQIRLRPKRLFDDDNFYWRALFVNAVLRFCWMMGFIPAYRVSIMDGSTQETFADKFNGWSFVILGSLEIFRRSIWGVIKVELETIKLTSGDDKDLTMASTADEYLREGKWNAWRRNADNNDYQEEVEEEEDSQIIWLNPSAGDKQHRSPAHFQTESSIFKNSARNQTHRWLGVTVSSNFIRIAYKVELLLWPLVFLVLSYVVILAE
jgi:hypothetical protein